MVKTFAEYKLFENEESVSGAINMINMLARITSGTQQEMYQQMSRDAREIKCVPLSEVFTKGEIAEIKSVVRPKAKCCYENAYHLASRMHNTGKEILYCEGYMVFHGLPIEHAFNKVNGLYVDITAELVLGDDVTKNDYVAYGEWDENTALRAMALDGCYGCVYQKLYMYNHQDNLKK